MKKYFVLFLLLLISPAAAQWQTPTHSVPIGRGGGMTGFDNAPPGAANAVLASNGPSTNPTFQPLLTLLNAVCTLTPSSCASLFGYWAPQWFGATPLLCTFCTPGLVPNNQSQVQAAITAAGTTTGGGTVLFSGGTYGIGNGVLVPSNVILKGVGVHGTSLLLQPNTPAIAVNFIIPTAPGGGACGIANCIVANCGIRDLQIASADTTILKIGLNFTDSTQCFADNIIISAYPSGLWTATGGTAVGLRTQGRELGIINNSQSSADTPIEIASNPNVAGGSEDLDSWSFRDLTLVGELAAATHHVVNVDASVSIFNTRFDGHQNWIGGLDGFHWVGSGAAASMGLYFSGLKVEQAPTAAGFAVNIQSINGLYNLKIDTSNVGDRKGILLRNVVNADIVSYMQVIAAVGMDADLTNRIINFSACYWLPGVTASLGAFTPSAVIHPAGQSAAVPASGVLYQ